MQRAFFFFKTYGYDYVPFLLSLASTSLITSLPIPKPSINKPSPPAPPPPFGPIRKAFRLLLEIDETNPTDISYVYAGYAPLSIRLVQCVAQKTAVLSSLPSPENNAGAAAASSSSSRNGDAHGDGEAGEVTTLKPFASPISGWKGFEDAVKLIPGATVDIVQQRTPSSNRREPLSIAFRFLSFRCLNELFRLTCKTLG